MTRHTGRVRMFAALIPPESAREDLAEFLDRRREGAAFRWTSPEQVHLTLAFYADVRPDRVDDLAEALGSAAGRRTPFALRIAGGDAFPHADRGKVLVTRVETDEAGAGRLESLATGTRNAAAAAGTTADGQRFRPHLTVARCGRPAQLTAWVRLLDSYRGPEWEAREVSLVESHLGEGPRRRARHEVVATLPLGLGPDPTAGLP